MLNSSEAVASAINKTETFRLLSGVDGLRIPNWYVDTPSSSFDGVLLARTSVTASGGDGIVVVRKGDVIPVAPLYVEYIPKRQEYRVHVVDSKCIFVQEKRRRSDNEQSRDEKLIRNYDNGWVFCPLELDSISSEIKDAAVMAVNGLGLCFGAVDLIIGRDCGSPYVLECNTAPGLSSPGLINAYKEAFETLCQT